MIVDRPDGESISPGPLPVASPGSKARVASWQQENGWLERAHHEVGEEAMRCMNSGWGPLRKPLHALHRTLTANGVSEWRTRSQGNQAQANLHAHAMMSWHCRLILTRTQEWVAARGGQRQWRINSNGMRAATATSAGPRNPRSSSRPSESGETSDGRRKTAGGWNCRQECVVRFSDPSNWRQVKLCEVGVSQHALLHAVVDTRRREAVGRKIWSVRHR
jgi:hypothetical protein